jgi:hypothetical protein
LRPEIEKNCLTYARDYGSTNMVAQLRSGDHCGYQGVAGVESGADARAADHGRFAALAPFKGKSLVAAAGQVSFTDLNWGFRPLNMAEVGQARLQ